MFVSIGKNTYEKVDLTVVGVNMVNMVKGSRDKTSYVFGSRIATVSILDTSGNNVLQGQSDGGGSDTEVDVQMTFGLIEMTKVSAIITTSFKRV